MFSAMQNVVPSHLVTLTCSISKDHHGSEASSTAAFAAPIEEIPLQPAGWQPEEDDTALEALRLLMLSK